MLTAESLSIHAPGSNTPLVGPLSFALSPGNPILLIGETGSGKSLIAQAMLGNITEDLEVRGKLWIQGTEYLSQPDSARQKLWGTLLGMLPQEPANSLDPTQKVQHQIAEVYELVRKETRESASSNTLADMCKFHVQSAKDKLPGELSGGMAQRLVFCCSLAGGTQILIVDEPTKGLDSDRKADVIKQLQAFAKDGGYLVVITHDIKIAEALGGATLVLRNGVLQEQKPTAELLANPEAAYTRALIDAAPCNWPEKAAPLRSTTPIISCQNVSKRFDASDLFTDMNLEIHRGEFVGLYGPSGTGKSTLGNILLELIKPDNGKVHKAPGYKPFQFLKLYQDPQASFSPFHTLLTSMEDILALHSKPRARLEELMTNLNLHPSLLERTPAHISGGELQRFAIVRTLLLDPVFLFADEPTSRLDPVTQKETMDLICSNARRIDCGMLLVSHDHELLRKSCDRVITLNAPALQEQE